MTRELIGKENVNPVDYGLDLVQDLRSGTQRVHSPIFFDEARLFLDNTKFKWPRTSIVRETIETPRTIVKAALVELFGMDGRATYKSVTDRLENDLASDDSLFVSAMWEARKTRSNVRLSNKVDSGQVWWADGSTTPYKTQYEACKAWLGSNYAGEAVNNSTDKRLKNMPNWCFDDAFRSPSEYAGGAMRVDQDKVIKIVGFAQIRLIAQVDRRRNPQSLKGRPFGQGGRGRAALGDQGQRSPCGDNRKKHGAELIGQIIDALDIGSDESYAMRPSDGYDLCFQFGPAGLSETGG